jgi:cytochrome oxidase Cu insertion factor (SCO1/SenC/PrrC family)
MLPLSSRRSSTGLMSNFSYLASRTPSATFSKSQNSAMLRVSATLDPARDTQVLLAQYVPQFNPSFIGLRGDDATMAATAKDFRAFYAKVPGATPTTYTIDHSTGSYAFDPQGRLRLLLKHGDDPANIAADLKLLLAGK